MYVNSSVLKNISYGMYAIGVKDGDKISACIVNSVTQISNGKELCLAVAINKESYSAYCVKKSGLFTISILSEDTPGSVIGALGLVSGKKTEKLLHIRHKVLIEGVPVIKENTCCWFLCELEKTVEYNNQYIFFGKIVAGSDYSIGKPMSYDFYTEVLKGTATKESPAYFPPPNTFDKSTGEAFVCSVCGYEYNDPNFSFEELGDKWVCPICKISKRAFVRKI